jgi:hypothetical protein
LGLWSARSQTGGLRRVTNTTEEGVNVNPSLSGDGRRISFESTKDLAGAGGNGFHALRADLSSDPATFVQMGVTRAPAAGISQDGSIIAFASRDDPLGTNTDGNPEIFLYSGTTLRQITNTAPSSASERTRQGNFQPSLTDDGRFIAFSSNRNLANQNGDGNLEIFIFDTASNTFTQLTNTAGAVGASDAKISGDGTRVAYIRDTNALPAVQRDLMLQDRAGATVRIIASNVTNLAFTYGRAISDDGLRIVYSADIAPNSSQVFLFDGRTTNSTRQITALGVRDTEVPLHPTISGDGTRIAFATRRPVTTAGANSDNSVELYTYDIPTGQFGRVTNVTSSVADGFDGSNRAAEVVSSLNDDGSIVAFNFPRTLSGAVTSGFENNTEIYVTGTAVRPTTGALTILNEASFGHEPSTTKAVAPDSRAVALGGALAFNTIQAHPDANGNFPTTLDGTSVTVNGRPAQIFFVSPEQVNFLVPAQTELGTATVVVTNAEGFQSRGTVTVLRAAPGIFTESRDGQGRAVALNADTGTGGGTFDPSSGNLRLVIFTTGVRKATQVTATAGGRALTVESVMQSPDMPGMDEVRVLVPADLRGAGQVDLVIRADNRESNTATINFSGNACRDIVINEVLADPPDGIEGDANHDNTRSSNDDEFVELVNTTTTDKDISGYQLLARSTSSGTDTVRHIFAAGTIFPAGSAIIIFSGGVEPNFNPANPVFGGAQVFKASSGGLALTNSGGVITLREPSLSIVNIFSYGASTGLNGDANQSLTRSPDAGVNSECGNFVLHSTAPGSNGNPFSPGTHVDGSPFASGLGRLTRVTIAPPSSSVAVGRTTQFTAQARDQFNRPIKNVTITFASDNTNVATVDSVTFDASTGIATATVTGRSEGTAHIMAQATDGTTTVSSSQATLTVNPVPAVVTRVEVSPPNAAINRGQTQQFTATAFDQNNQPIAGATFTWASSDPNVATINSSGLATGLGLGSVTITATTSDATGATTSGTAGLNVQIPLVINEINADVAADNASTPAIEGDANRDGVRDSDDDEFIELLNNSNASVDISGVIIADATSNRFTIPANTTLGSGRALIIFGGGTPPASDPAFGGALVLAISGTLSLNDTGDTVNVKLNFGGSDHQITSVTYGGTGNPAAPGDQSLTRSPDAEVGTAGGSFIAHSTATNAAGRTFSPGTRTDGTPFGSPAITRIEVAPASATIDIGASQTFTARAFSNAFGPEIEIQNVSFIWDSSDPSKATVAPVTGASTVAKGVASGNNITIRARAGGQQGAATLTVNAPPTTDTYSVSGQVKDAGNNPLSGVLITFDMNFQGTLSTKTTLTDANGNYSSGDLGCQNNVKVTPSKVGYTFAPSATSFVNSSQCLSGSNTANFTATLVPSMPPPAVVISQIYGGGGTAGAQLTNDFIEVFNRGTTTIDLAGWSVQYTSASGTGNWSVTPLCPTGACLLGPGRYFLVHEAAGGGGTTSLPAPDAVGSIAMAITNGKVALVTNTTPLTGACPLASANLVDLVGYGGTTATANFCFEGSGPATAPSNVGADFRRSGGCQDTNDNAADFIVSTANPRNSTSPANDCSGGLKPDIAINNVTVTEGDGGTINATFTVTLFGSSTSNVTVDFATADGTATAGSDYQSNNGTLTFAPGQTTQTINVAVIGDTTDEAAETFFVNLTNATNGFILDNQGQGTINDNDAAPTISINDTSVTEGDSGTTNATFNVTLSAVSGQQVTVNYATADSTATVGTDYQSTSGTLTFNPGQTTQTITVLVNGDTTFEQNETFFVNLTTPTNATILDNQGVGTITNDDAAPPVPAISINDVSVTEGNSGTKTLDFTVSLSMTPTAITTVDYATANGTATSGSDYQSASGTVTFNPGETSKPVSITINGDTLVEPDETFSVNLTNASANAIINDNQGQGMITNDDTANIVISQVYGGGGNAGATYKNDFIEIFNRGTTTVDFSVSNYSVQYASAGANFGSTSASSKTNLTSGTIAPGQYFLIQEASGGASGVALPMPDATGTIAMGNTSGKVALVAGTLPLPAFICPGDDGVAPFNPSDGTIADFIGYGSVVCYEGAAPAPAPSNTTADFRKAGGCVDTNDNAADFLVSATNPRNTASPLNDCSAGLKPDITINDVTVSESTANATFTVTLSTPSTLTVTVNYATADGTATAGSDYQATSGTLTFTPGQTTQTILVPFINDTTDEPSETFFVNLTNATNGTILDNQGQGTITDNDNPPTLSINDVSVAEGNSGTTAADFTVTLSAASAFTVTVNYATADNSATAASDYQSASGTLTFTPGETTKTITVLVNGDTTFEQNETFFVDLSGASNASTLDAQGQGTITNDDAAPPTPALSITDVSMTEGNAGTTTVNFTVSLSPTSSGTVTVDYATANSSAIAPSDYQSASGTLTFNPGDTTKTITVTINGDTLVEPDETFFVNLSNQSVNAIISDAQGVGTITNDDAASVVISQVYGGGGNAGATYKNDFIEILNRGNTIVDISGWSVQYRSATGTTGSWDVTNLCSSTVAGTCLLQPGQYYLVQEAAGTGGTTEITEDIAGTIVLAATGGKVALVNSRTNLGTTTCPIPSANVVDFVGYGNADCFEGSAPAPTPTSTGTTADFRKSGGCLDTDQNATDFFVASPFPRNTASPLNDCSGGLRPDITINDRTLSESTTPQNFTVTLSMTSTQTVTVDYSTANGTATAGADYTAVNGTLTFAPGETTKTINVPIINDALDELDETYFVNLSNASNAILIDNQGQGTITDNDNTPTLSINDVSVTEGDSGTKTLDFTVTLSTASGQTVTVNYATADGTATAGTDYVAASGMLTFLPGDTTKTVSVTINGDTVVEPNETFLVNLTTPVNATITDGIGQGTITNDDVTPSLSITDVTANEGNAGTTAFTFTVTLSPSSTQTVTVDYATADGTATAPTDYTAIAATQLTFAPGETSKQVTVQVNGDTTVEPDETFFVNLSNPTNATITDNQGVGTITNDDAAAASADLSVTKTDTPDPAFTGNDITYTITVNNGGPDAAVNAVLADTVPTNTTFRSITAPAGWTCSTVPAVGATGSISCSNPSFSAGPSVFSLVVRVAATVANGTVISNTASVSSSTADSNNPNNSATTTTTVNSPLVITQVYGGGNNSGATYKNDFIEIFNRGKTTIDFSVTPYSVQYTAATGNFGTLKTDITSGTIASGQYFLIQESGGTTNGAALPTPDATGTINLDANSGKVALVLGTTALSGTCPGDDGVTPFNPAGSGVVDFLGYGFGTTTNNPNCFEGSARASTASATANARSIMRTVSCTDTNDNAADFTYTNSTGTSPPVARNKATTPAPCP